ncbi:MAG: thioredoxin family protein [Melioribacteraceae bacterium]|nr:thioredoxin family protein [Melioribacteraceae bacterium]
MEEVIIEHENELNNFISDNEFAVVYFSTAECNVCKVLKPKLKSLLAAEFPNAKFGYVDLMNSKQIKGQQSIFTVPTIIFYFNGSESFRESRNINLSALTGRLSRPYSLMFD